MPKHEESAEFDGTEKMRPLEIQGFLHTDRMIYNCSMNRWPPFLLYYQHRSRRAGPLSLVVQRF